MSDDIDTLTREELLELVKGMLPRPSRRRILNARIACAQRRWKTASDAHLRLNEAVVPAAKAVDEARVARQADGSERTAKRFDAAVAAYNQIWDASRAAEAKATRAWNVLERLYRAGEERS